MALKVESLDSQPALTLEIPLKSQVSVSTPVSSSPVQTRPSSDDSAIPTPSTTTETTEAGPSTTSCSSLPTLNVKFAPLPELLPRKRRSTVPLGMAARGQLLRRRPEYRGRNSAPPLWTNEGTEHRMRREELAARHARCNAYAAYAAARIEDEEEDNNDLSGKKKGGQEDDDDPLQVLGRIVKVAGKTLWKRVSNKDIAAAATTTTATSVSKLEEDLGNRQASPGSPPPLRPILGTSNTTSDVGDQEEEEEDAEGVVVIEGEDAEEEEEEGGVWEEEIGTTFPRDVSQTETIFEERAVYSRLTSTVEALNGQSPPASPTVSKSKNTPSFLKSARTKKVPPL